MIKLKKLNFFCFIQLHFYMNDLTQQYLFLHAFAINRHKYKKQLQIMELLLLVLVLNNGYIHLI